MRRIVTQAVLATLFIAPPAHAQWNGLVDRSDQLHTERFSFTGLDNPERIVDNENYYAGDMGDFDGDGRIDRALISRYGILWNTGGGLMTPANRALTGFYLLRAGGPPIGNDATQWVDLDNDGDLDNVQGGNSEPLVAQFNRGGRFSIGWSKSGANTSALNVVSIDLEKDGDVDLIVPHAFCSSGTCGGPVSFGLYLNDGTGRFTEVSAQRGIAFNGTQNIVGAMSGDMDGDGDFDIVLGYGPTRETIVAINDGRGYFTQRRFRVYSAGSGFGQWGSLGDVDDDGDLDLVVTGAGDHSGAHAVVKHVVAINDGQGNLREESSSRFDAAGTTQQLTGDNGKLADIDYDGDLDFLSFRKSNFGAGIKHLQVFLNDGRGRFRYDPAHSVNFPGVTAMAALGSDLDITDLDGDGTYDVWLGISGDRVRTMINTYRHPSGIRADEPRGLRVVSAASGGVTLTWQAPPFAATARHYRVYRSLAPGLEARDRVLVKTIALSRFEDEAFSAPITRHTTTADLGDPDVQLDGSRNAITFIDRTAQAGLQYWYSVAHVGTENTVSAPAPEVTATVPRPAGGTDTAGPQIAIVSPTDQEWSRLPRIVVAYGDAQSGVDPATVEVAFDAPLGASGSGRPALANVADLAYVKTDRALIAYLAPPLSLPLDTLVTMRVRVRDRAGNESVQRVQFYAGEQINRAPTADIELTAQSGARVDLSGGRSSDPDGKILRYEWYFGDGTTGVGRTVTKTYAGGGSYRVELRVRDHTGNVAVATRTVTVAGPPPPPPPDAGIADSGVTTPPRPDAGFATPDAGFPPPVRSDAAVPADAGVREEPRIDAGAIEEPSVDAGVSTEVDAGETAEPEPQPQPDAEPRPDPPGDVEPQPEPTPEPTPEPAPAPMPREDPPGDPATRAADPLTGGCTCLSTPSKRADALGVLAALGGLALVRRRRRAR